NAFALQNGLAHVDAHLPRATALDFQFQREHAPAGLDREGGLPHQAVVIHILGDATDAVAAHLGFAAVGVVHAHSGIGLVGRAEEDQAIRTDAAMPVADHPAESSRVVRHRLAEAIHVDVIIAGAVHFGETHVCSRPG